MHIQNPAALFLLLALIPVIWMAWPRRGYGRSREITAVILRCLIITLLVFAAAGIELRQPNNNLSVIFLVDISDSVSEDLTEKSRGFIQSAIQGLKPDDKAGIILFGGDALIERALTSDKSLGPFTSIPNTSQTDLAEAVRLAVALFPGDTARRLVLLSDGRETTGDAVSAARLAVNAGVEFVIVPLVDESQAAEVTLLGLELPSTLLEGENFELSFRVHSRTQTLANVRLLSAGNVLFDGAAELSQGFETYRIPLTAGEPGFTAYQLQISTVTDTYDQNNRLTAFTRVSGPPKILIVAPPPGEALPFTGETRPEEAQQLAQALEAGGFTVDLIHPSSLPFELPLLSDYATVIFVDVPARDLSDRQLATLQSFVRDLGGGYIAVGGPTAFGVGGYFRTPLAEILPVEMEIKDQERRPDLSMVFIIDRSGSMSDTNSGVTKLALAKEAAASSIDLLFPGDKIGVIAFDEAASWVVPLTDLSEPAAIKQQIETIGIGGGTDILAGLQAMAQTLPGDDAQVKHVILLTDGGANSTGIPELVENLYRVNGITLTTVGVGSDAAAFLQDIAIIGGGRYHFTDRPETIPNIFTAETTLATRSYIVEETFFPSLVNRSPILNQINQVPSLSGYVATSSKDTAQVILESHLGDPILSTWQYGLGKAVAWTSDATTRWATEWVNWEQFAAFWGQAVRFTITDRTGSPLRARIEQQKDLGKITIEAVSDQGQFLNNLAITANLIHPDGTVERLDIPQTAPGLYEASFMPSMEGAYLLGIDAVNQSSDETITTLTGWVLSYSKEYQFINEDPELLSDLAQSTEGELVTLAESERATATPKSTAVSRHPLWPLFLTFAISLLPVDIAVRRLAFTRTDMAFFFSSITSKIFQRENPEHAETSHPQIASLQRAKARAGSREQDQIEVSSERDLGEAVPPAEEVPEINIQESKWEITTESRPVEITDEDENRPSTTSKLLARKRARQNRNKKD